MIEGLRSLPFFDAKKRSDPSAMGAISNCGECRMKTDAATRRRMGCGFEEPDARARAWSPDGLTGPRLTVCAGYTTALPEVQEIAVARFFMEKGALAQWSDEPIAELSRAGLAILASACADQERAAFEEQQKKQKASAR